MYADNNLNEGVPNHLCMLHPGNVACEEIEAWPLPRHPDESADREGIFSQIYKKAFVERDGAVFQERTLTGWDRWADLEDSDRRVFTRRDVAEQDRVRRDFDAAEPSTRVPFTSWTVGPFCKHGSHLLTFRLVLTGVDNMRVIQPYQASEFRIEGPQQIYDHLRFVELTGLSPLERRQWESRLQPFDENRLPSGEGYDVIFLRSGGKIEIDNLVGATQAPIQPDDGDRFISAHQSFRLEFHLR
jgi:hypothetical protein